MRQWMHVGSRERIRRWRRITGRHRLVILGLPPSTEQQKDDEAPPLDVLGMPMPRRAPAKGTEASITATHPCELNWRAEAMIISKWFFFLNQILRIPKDFEKLKFSFCFLSGTRFSIVALWARYRRPSVQAEWVFSWTTPTRDFYL